MGAYTQFISNRRQGGSGLWVHPVYNNRRRGGGFITKSIKQLTNKAKNIGKKIISKSKGDLIKAGIKSGVKLMAGQSPGKVIADLVKSQAPKVAKKSLAVLNHELGVKKIAGLKGKKIRVKRGKRFGGGLSNRKITFISATPKGIRYQNPTLYHLR